MEWRRVSLLHSCLGFGTEEVNFTQRKGLSKSCLDESLCKTGSKCSLKLSLLMFRTSHPPRWAKSFVSCGPPFAFLSPSVCDQAVAALTLSLTCVAVGCPWKEGSVGDAPSGSASRLFFPCGMSHCSFCHKVFPDEKGLPNWALMLPRHKERGDPPQVLPVLQHFLLGSRTAPCSGILTPAWAVDERRFHSI